jgi:hypothetical protein
MGEGKPKEDKPEHFLEVYYPDNISLLAHMLNEAEVSLRRLNDPNDFIAPQIPEPLRVQYSKYLSQYITLLNSIDPTSTSREEIRKIYDEHQIRKHSFRPSRSE